MTAAIFRRIALGLAGAVEGAHMVVGEPLTLAWQAASVSRPQARKK